LLFDLVIVVVIVTARSLVFTIGQALLGFHAPVLICHLVFLVYFLLFVLSCW